MDLESTYLVIGVFVISAAILLIIDYLFKNKSYEETVAEQRQQTNALFASQHRPKVKDKKQKKAVKKQVKDKKNSVPKETTSSPSESATESESTEKHVVDPIDHHKHHVEFKEPAVSEETAKDLTKRKSKDMVRPILVNRDSSAENIQANTEALPANHFEELHPKDELELFNSHTKEEKITEKKRNRQNSDVEVVHQKSRKSSKVLVQEVVVVKEVDAVEKVEPTIEPIVVQPNGISIVTVKEKKKKKNEANTLAQIASDKQGVNLASLIPLVRKAEMSRVEVQILIDMLLNKQQDAPVIDDWSEGKGDPVQKLKKQLAERERQVAELQDTLTGSQAKLRDIRGEQTADRMHFTQSVRELEEALKMSKLERQILENKMQNATVNFQQMQDKLKDEGMKTSKIMEEYGNLKLQRQQMELHLTQAQEAEVTIAQLRTELQDLQNRRTMENHVAMEHSLLQVKQLQHQINSCKEDLEKKECRIRELKEVNVAMEQRLSLVLREVDDFKSEKSQLKSELQRSMEEIRRLEHGNSQEVQLLLNGKDELQQNQAKLVTDLKTLNNELVILKQEKANLKDENAKFNDDLLKFKKINSSLEEENSRLQGDTKKLLLESRMNGSVEETARVGQLNVELSTAKMQLAQAEDVHRKELDALRALHQKEIEEQKNKNNELRQKNWKVVEALNVAESRCKTAEKQAKANLESTSSVTQTDSSTKSAFVQRLMVDCKELESLPEDECEALVTKFVYENFRNVEKKAEDSSEISKLKIQVLDYKKIIDETDGVLSRLQTDITEAEIRWRKELKNKEELISRLNEQIKMSKSETIEVKNSILDSCVANNEACEVQNNHMNGPELPVNDLTLSTGSSATSSIAELPVKKNKKKKSNNEK